MTQDKNNLNSFIISTKVILICLYQRFSDDLKWEKQVRSAAGKANSMLAILNNTFTYMDKNLMKTLFCTYVRPHLEFAIQA
jgi:ribonucleases P/MRP protein subunit RPP40